MNRCFTKWQSHELINRANTIFHWDKPSNWAREKCSHPSLLDDWISVVLVSWSMSIMLFWSTFTTPLSTHSEALSLIVEDESAKRSALWEFRRIQRKWSNPFFKRQIEEISPVLKVTLMTRGYHTVIYYDWKALESPSPRGSNRIY